MSEDGNAGEGRATIKKKIMLSPTKELEVEVEIDPELLKSKKIVDARASEIALELTSLGLPTDSSEISTDNIKEKFDELKALREKHEEDELKVLGDADPTRKLSSGSLTLAGQNAGEEPSFDSHEELIEFLQEKANSTDQNEEARVHRIRAKKIIEQLYRKSFNAKRTNPAPFQGTEFKGEIDPETGKEEGVVKTMNRMWRKRNRELIKKKSGGQEVEE